MRFNLLSEKVFPSKFFQLKVGFLALVLVTFSPILLLAEGSKDFRNYPGKRLWLDTRDNQQLKVYAAEGEFINVGASHAGVAGGFIEVYTPAGVLDTIFDNTGPDFGFGSIENDVQELNGPTGGGTLNGDGYIPGVIQVPPGMGGIWTVRMAFPQYQIAAYAKLENSDPWTKGQHQNISVRVILAWDITISQNAAANDGGSMLEGRVYSNEYISIINGNGSLTSPEFIVLSRDGFQYLVNFVDTDPFRFPISSNSLGLTTNDFMPIYKSEEETDFVRSPDPNTWIQGGTYLYEPQAQDFGPIVNNKIFFNPPDSNMPGQALTTDVFANMDDQDPANDGNTHMTWLFNEAESLELASLGFVGADPDGVGCEIPYIQLGEGGWFVFDLNINGFVELQLDIDNNQQFNDPIDVTLSGNLNGGIDSLFWNGMDGLGNVFGTAGTTLTLNFTGFIRFGEIHIANTDVENNIGGVTFELLNPPVGIPADVFLFDHSDLGGDVSGGGTPGNALPTNIPFTYTNSFGNDNYLDQWVFSDLIIPETMIDVIVVEDCTCTENDIPVLETVASAISVCEGENATLQVFNTTAGLAEIIYTWTGPNGYFYMETIGGDDTSTVNINDVTLLFAGDYIVGATTPEGCDADPVVISLVINELPQLVPLAANFAACEGADLTITATNSVQGIGAVTYTWSGPNFTFTDSSTGDGNYDVVITNINANQAGTYTLTVETSEGCSSMTSVEVAVNANPVLTDIGGGGEFCEGASTVLTATNSTAGITEITYSWSGPNGFFVTTTTIDVNAPMAITISNLELSNTGTYTLSVTTDAGCTVPDVMVDITVNANPTIINVMGDEVCVGADLFLTASNAIAGVGNLIYTWTGPNFTYTATVGEGDAMTATVAGATLTDSGDYTISVVSENGCTTLDQVAAGTVFDNPQITDLTAPTSVCEGGTIILTGSNSGTGMNSITYSWTGPNGLLDQQTTQNIAGPFEFTLSNLTQGEVGDYTLCIESDQGCGPVCQTTTISVNAGLEIVNLTGAGDYCAGETISLSAENSVTGGITTVTFTWTLPDGSMVTGTAPPAGPFILDIPNSTVDDSGTYLLDLVSDAGCISMQASLEVTVNDNPVLTVIQGGGGYCLGENILLSSNNTVAGIGVITYTWTLPDGSMVTGTVADTNPIELSLTDIGNDDAGTYTLSVETSVGCTSDTLSTEVIINEMPMIAGITTDTVVCETEGLTLYATNASAVTATYSWTGPNGYNASGTAGAGATFTELINPIEDFGPGDYILILTSNEGCASDSDTVMVEVSPKPVLSTIFGGGAYCVGDTAVIQVVNTNPLVDSIYYTCILPNTSINVVLLGGQDTFTIIIPDLQLGEGGFIFCSGETLDSCGADLVSTEIIVQPTPEIMDISAESPYCDGDDATLTATNGAQGVGTITYTWTGPNAFNFTDMASFEGPFPLSLPNISVDQAGEYCLILETDAGCISDTSCITIEVNPTPELSPTDGGGEYCAGDTITLSTMNITPGLEMDTLTYECTDPAGNTSTGFVIGNEPIVIIIEGVIVDDSGIYSCVVTSSDGCVSNISSANVTVNATPIIEEIDGGGPYCEDETATLTALNMVPGVGTITYTWLNPDGSVLFSGQAGEMGPFDVNIPNLTVDDAGEYCLILESDAGCGSDQQCVTIVVNPNPVIAAFDGGGAYCEGDIATISADMEMNGAASIDWEINGPNNFNESGTITMDESVSFDITVSEMTVGTYTLNLTSDQDCTASQSLNISLNSVATPILETSTDFLCPGDELQLVVTNADEYDGQVVEFSWFENGTLLGTTLDAMFLIADPTGGNYSVAVVVDGCGESSAEVNVPIFDAPTAVDDQFETDINVSIDGNVTSNDDAGGGAIIVVSNTDPNNGTVVVNEDGSFSYTPNENFAGDDSFQYTICSVECPNECSTATVTITINLEDLVIPNVMTPNGDGDNDLFVIPGLQLFGDNELRIFNRWGDEVHFAKPYQNDWDGTQDGKALPSSTYFILLDLGNGDDPIAQFLTIVR